MVEERRRGMDRGPSLYLGALVIVAVATLVALRVQSVADPIVFLLVGVVIVAWFAGLGPALVATVVSTLAVDYFFTPPLYTVTPELSHLSRLAAFGLTAALFASASARRRSAERALQQARDELEAKVRERTADLEELAGRLIHAQEEERRRIGRELHDHISQMVGVLAIGLDQLRMDEAIPTAVVSELEELRQDATDIAREIHGLSHRLHSSTLDHFGLVAALQRLVGDFSTRYGIVIDFDYESVPARIPSEIALCLFRVTEESLTNIAKHSAAKSGRVQLRGTSDGVQLSIEDSGVGFDNAAVERRGGLGLVSMRERLRAVRGAIRVDSAPSRGTKIDVWLPSVSLLTAQSVRA